MSMKREAESNSPNSEENGASIPTASSNKRIKTATSSTSSKRATRASTGAPITLTAKGSLYRAHKDTGPSSDEAEPPSSSRLKVVSTGQSSSVSASAAAGNNHGESMSTGVPRGSATQRGRKQEGDGKCSSSMGNSSSKNGSSTRADYSQANNGGAVTQAGGGGGGEGGVGKMGGRGSGNVAVGRGVNVSSGGVPANGEGEPPPMLSADGDAPSAPPRRRGRKGRSIYRGVCVTREGKWRAVIYKERKQLYLGVYESELEAAKAHDRAARFHFPDKAMTNFESEEEADRLLKSEEQQRRVKQEVDRDLAPLRRLGALAAAGRELEGYPDPQRRDAPTARPRLEGGRVRRAFGGNQGSSHLNASAGVEAEVLEGNYETAPWDEEGTGYRSRPPSPTDKGEDQREYSGPSPAMESSKEGGKGGPRDSSGASRPTESSPGWKREGNGSSGENGYDFYDRYRKARANGEVEETEDATDSRSSRSRMEAAEAREWRGGPGSVTADRRASTGPAFPSHPKSQREASPDERSVGVIDGASAAPVKWGSSADGVRPGRSDHGQWQARFEHGSGKADGKGDEFYWGAQGRGGRAWGSGGDALDTTGNRGPSGMAATNAVTEGEHVADNRHAAWSSRRHVSGKALSSRGGGHTRSPRPEHIAIIEAKMARARQEDAETAAAAEAAMVMAGYGGDWLRRGASRNESGKGNRTRGTGSRVDADADTDADEGKVDNARALDATRNPRHPRHRQRPHITVRASRGSNGTQLSSDGRTAFGDGEQAAAEKCVSGPEHDAWRRGGRELVRGKPEESSGWESDWGWRASGDPHDNVYPPSARRGGVGQGRSRGWNVSTRDGEGFLGDADGHGGLIDIRPSYAQKRVAAAGAAAGVEPITVAAAAAAVALKYSHRIPNGGNGHGRSGRSSDASYRWPGGAASEPGNSGRGGGGFRNGDVAVTAHEGKHVGSPGLAYARDRGAREWSGPGTVEGPLKGEFSPLYRDGREDAPRPPGAARSMRGCVSGVSNAGSSASRQGIFAMSSPPRIVDEAERDRPLRRIKRTPHDVYACGGFDGPLKNSDGGHGTSGGGESQGQAVDGIAHGSTTEASGVARQLTPGAEGHNPGNRSFANGTSDKKRDSGGIGTADDGGASRTFAGSGKRSGEVSKESQAVDTMDCHDHEDEGTDKCANGVLSSKRVEGDDEGPPAIGKGGGQDRAS